MAISDNQKLDFLWKKIGFSATKTDVNSSKGATNEAIPSPLLIRGDQIWGYSDQIPAAIPSDTTEYVEIYNDGSNGQGTVETTADGTASENRTWLTNLTDWITPEFGSTYQVKVYAAPTGTADPETSGTRLFAAGSGNNDEWFFDYKSGVLNFIGDNLPASLNGTNVIYISGARYVGPTGRQAFVDAGLDSAAVAEIASNTALDSAETINLINLYSLDSSQIINLIDSDYIQSRTRALIVTLVDSAVNELIDGAPGALNTLKELADALGNDSNAYNTLLAAIDGQLDSAEAISLIQEYALDSSEVLNLITKNSLDSDEVLRLIDTGSLDSAEAISLIQEYSLDSAEVLNLITKNSLDSDEVLRLVDAGSLDSAEATNLINSLVDSNYIQARQFTLDNVSDRDSDEFGGSGIQVTGSIIPSEDSAFTLGSPDRKFAGLYVSGQTIYIGDLKVSDTEGSFEVKSVDSTGNEETILKQGKGAIFLEDFAFVDSGGELFLRPLTSNSEIIDSQFTNVNAETLTLNNALRGPSQFVIDPYPYLSDSGEVVVRGNLRVDGELTTIQSTTLTINDKLIVIADSAPDAAAADGAGLIIDGAGASLTYNASLDKFVFNKGIIVPNFEGQYLGFDSDFDSALSTKTTSDLTEGDNLYYTRDRVDSDFDARFDSSFDERLATKTTTDVDEGDNLYYTRDRVDSDFDARFDSSFDERLATKTTDNITEGDNLYYTKDRVDSDFDARFDSSFDERLATKTTDNITEGDNLYYTQNRVDSDILSLVDSGYVLQRTPLPGLVQDSDNTIILKSSILPDTDLAYSIGAANRRIKDLFVGDGTIYIGNVSLSTDSATGRISVGIIDSDGVIIENKGTVALIDSSQVTGLVSDFVDSALIQSLLDTSQFVDSSQVQLMWDSSFGTKTTTDLPEGNNLYYTDARVDSAFDIRLTTKTTADLAEGDNLYYTKARVDSDVNSAIDALIDGAPDALNTLNELAQALNDDSNFAASITSSINSKLDSSQVSDLISQLSLDSSQVSDLITSQVIDSASVSDIINDIVDSAYISSISTAQTGLVWTSSSGGDYRTNTGYKDSDGTVFTVREAAFVGSKLRLELASFTPTVSATTSSTLNWDQTVSNFSVSVQNPDDFTDRYIANALSISQVSGSVSTNLSNFLASSKTATPAGGVDWSQTFTPNNDTSFIRSTSTTISGGNASGRINFEENNGSTWTNTATFNVSWRTPNVSISMSNLSGSTFLQTYSSTSYNVSISGMSSSSNYSHAVTPTGGSVSNASGSGTFTFTTPIHKNNGGGRTLSLSTDLTRPETVTGTSYVVTDTASDTSLSATFTYPSFWIFTSSVSTAPTRENIIDGTSFESAVNQLSNQTRNFSGFVSNGESIPQAFWFAVRSAASQPSTFQTGASASLLSDVSPTQTTIDLEPDSSPAGYVAEEYTIYGLTLQPGSTYVSIS